MEKQCNKNVGTSVCTITPKAKFNRFFLKNIPHSDGNQVLEMSPRAQYHLKITNKIHWLVLQLNNFYEPPKCPPGCPGIEHFQGSAEVNYFGGFKIVFNSWNPKNLKKTLIFAFEANRVASLNCTNFLILAYYWAVCFSLLLFGNVANKFRQPNRRDSVGTSFKRQPWPLWPYFLLLLFIGF
jgi:hypothetical protein